MLNIHHTDGRDASVRLSSVQMFFLTGYKDIWEACFEYCNLSSLWKGYLVPINWKKSENALAVFDRLIIISFDMTKMYNQFTSSLSFSLCFSFRMLGELRLTALQSLLAVCLLFTLEHGESFSPESQHSSTLIRSVVGACLSIKCPRWLRNNFFKSQNVQNLLLN